MCQFPMGMVHTMNHTASSHMKSRKGVNSLWVWFTERHATAVVFMVRSCVNSLWVWFTKSAANSLSRVKSRCQFPMGMVHFGMVRRPSFSELVWSVSIPYGYGSRGATLPLWLGFAITVSIPYGYGSRPPPLCGRYMIPHFPAKNHPNFRSVQRAPAQYEIVKTAFWEPDLASI